MAAEMTPYVSAAVGAYGGAVLAKVRDDAADATVGLGRRLLQRVFGARQEGESLPQPLADLAADPGDGDALAAVRLAVRQALTADPVLAGEVRSLLAAAPGAWQRVRAGRDAYSVVGTQTVINQYEAGAGKPPVPGLLRRVWGDIPPRNPGFAGREGLLAAIRTALPGADRAVVRVLYGLGGVGKTQLAVEYAHRFADSYDLVWWIAAEQVDLIGPQFAALADVLGCRRPGGGTAELRRAVLAELRSSGRSLVIFDNAEDPEYLASWLPGGGVHVLITSRTRRWSDIAVSVEVDVLPRAESIALLTGRMPTLAPGEADQLADALGDLPLALTQAAEYMTETSTPAGEYIGLLNASAAEMLDQGRPVSYPQSLAAVVRLAFERLRGEDPAAAGIAALCGFLAPEPVPTRWFTNNAGLLTLPGEQAGNTYERRVALARIGRHGLARISADTLRMHRLTRAVLRAQQSPEQAAASWARAEAVLVASHPGDPQNPSSWPGWARMLPHLLALDPDASSSPDVRSLACDAAWYLGKRGAANASHDLAERLYRQWRDQLGTDHPDTLHAAYNLAFALGELGLDQKARDLDEDTLTRRRRLLGDSHPDTIRSAINLAARFRLLGNGQVARDLDQDTLIRSRQALGVDHPVTLGCASNLAVELCELGSPQEAREIEQDTFQRRRRLFGQDHPDTLLSGIVLAVALRELGDPQAARELDEDTLARYQRIVGNDHPYTLRSASGLAADLRALGDLQAARELDEDTLARYQRVFGRDYPYTLRSASGLAADLRALGDLQAARELDEDTLARYQRVSGLDHPDTLSCASGLAADLRALGDLQAARELDEDTLARYQRVFGKDHPYTLRSASSLAADLQALEHGQSGGRRT
jgi:hypothetical protein